MDTNSNLEKKGRTLVLGDQHGGFKAFLQVMERCKFDNKVDKLITLGDVADGWSETAELVEYLIHLQETSDKRHIFLRGNHDAWTGEWLEFGRANPNWLPQGGQATVESYIRTGFVMSQSHRDFFKNLHNYYIDEDNRVFVHGGFTSHRGAGHEHYASDYYWDRTLWEMALVSHNSKDKVENKKFFNNHKEVYLGHTTTGNWKMKSHYPEHKYPEQASSGKITVPMNRCNVWNMDTGGGFEGKLTIMDIDTKEFWQSDFLNEIYPNERGR
jgi:serine/threonine protein phosphatase 1